MQEEEYTVALKLTIEVLLVVFLREPFFSVTLVLKKVNDMDGGVVFDQLLEMQSEWLFSHFA